MSDGPDSTDEGNSPGDNSTGNEAHSPDDNQQHKKHCQRDYQERWVWIVHAFSTDTTRRARMTRPIRVRPSGRLIWNRAVLCFMPPSLAARPATVKRRDRDSNPGDRSRPTGFQGQRIRPLCHPSRRTASAFRQAHRLLRLLRIERRLPESNRS